MLRLGPCAPTGYEPSVARGGSDPTHRWSPVAKSFVRSFVLEACRLSPFRSRLSVPGCGRSDLVFRSRTVPSPDPVPFRSRRLVSILIAMICVLRYYCLVLASRSRLLACPPACRSFLIADFSVLLYGLWAKFMCYDLWSEELTFRIGYVYGLWFTSTHLGVWKVPGIFGCSFLLGLKFFFFFKFGNAVLRSW